jgi:putative MFS transporter
LGASIFLNRRALLRKGRVKECEAMMIKLFGEPVVFDEEPPQDAFPSVV